MYHGAPDQLTLTGSLYAESTYLHKTIQSSFNVPWGQTAFRTTVIVDFVKLPTRVIPPTGDSQLPNTANGFVMVIGKLTTISSRLSELAGIVVTPHC